MELTVKLSIQEQNKIVNGHLKEFFPNSCMSSKNHIINHVLIFLHLVHANEFFGKKIYYFIQFLI